MEALQESLRQLRTAAILIAAILVIGVLGFMLLEQIPLLDAIWMTIITLSTIGYGDMVPQTDLGRLFNLALIVIGLGSFAYAIQAAAELLLSPTIRNLQMERLIRRRITKLNQHFIISGSSVFIAEIVRLVIGISQTNWQGTGPSLADRLLRRNRFPHPFVVITNDQAQATALREQGVLALVGSPADDQMLQDAGIERAHAMMITLQNDAANMLTVLTARQYNRAMLITSTAMTEEISPRLVRSGANRTILPYEIGGNFLNMATLRPVVSDFFRYILFNLEDEIIADQFPLSAGAPCINQPLHTMRLDQYEAGVIAIRRTDGTFAIAPPPDYRLAAGEIVIAVSPIRNLRRINAVLTGQPEKERWKPTRQQFAYRMEHPHAPLAEDAIPTPEAIQQQITGMSSHYIIWADGQAGRQAVENLDPARPFVIITHDEAYADALRRVGFRVMHCPSPDPEAILLSAGIERALSLMISQQDDATSVLTVLTARSLNAVLNITAEASSEAMAAKLQQAGANRVSLPLQVAAEVIIVSTVRPVVSDFFQHVVFNRETGLETTELIVRPETPFVGQTLQDLALEAQYDGHVIGIRNAAGQIICAPPRAHRLQAGDVLIAVVPMPHADELRTLWHGTKSGRLATRTLEMPKVEE